MINNPDRLTSDEIRELHDNGWSINSHTHTHSTLHGLSKAEQRREIKTAAETLKAHGFDEPTAIMYPGGQCDQTTLELAAEYHQCGFTAHTSIRKGLTQTVTASSHFINRSRSSTFEEAKTAIDTAIEYTATYPAYWHTIGPDGEISEADFQAVCEYLSKRSEAIDVVRPEAITLSV